MRGEGWTPHPQGRVSLPLSARLQRVIPIWNWSYPSGMTVIVNAILAGRVLQIVDRQISRTVGTGIQAQVIDTTSTKVCVVRCANALVSIAYTGVAVASQQWMDLVLARCLAQRRLEYAMIQPGTHALARPIHVVMKQLAINLNGKLNADERTRREDILFSIAGWHLGRRLTPLLWQLKRGPMQSNGNRYFELDRTEHRVGKFLREDPYGLYMEHLGDSGATVDSTLREIRHTTGANVEDELERFICAAIRARAAETTTVGSSILAVQLDPRNREGQIQFTTYPDDAAIAPPPLQSGWTLTPAMICSPSSCSTFGATYSDCGNYIMGGYIHMEDNVHVRTRLPVSDAHHGGPVAISFGTQRRIEAP